MGVLTLREASKKFSINYDALWFQVKSGKIPSVKTGNRIFIEERDLEKYFDDLKKKKEIITEMRNKKRDMKMKGYKEIGRIERVGGTYRIIVYLTKKNTFLIDVRKYFHNESGEWLSTRKGLMMPEELARKVMVYLEEALSFIERMKAKQGEDKK